MATGRNLLKPWAEISQILMSEITTYSAYGLNIQSALPLPELLPAAEAEADVRIRIGQVRPAESAGDQFFFEGDQGCLAWEQVGRFLVRRGEEIIIDPLDGATQQLIRLPLLGAVMAVLLHQRGLLVLHASAVAIDGEAVIFMGEKGWGKSTIAAMMYARGHRIIADDVVALSVEGGQPALALPGYPQLKLWPDAVKRCIGREPEDFPRIASDDDKRVCRTADGFSLEPTPVGRIYILSFGDAPGLRPLSPREAFLQLVSNSYVARFGNDLLQQNKGARHLQQCAQLISSTSIGSLERPASLSLLEDIARLVEDDRLAAGAVESV